MQEDRQKSQEERDLDWETMMLNQLQMPVTHTVYLDKLLNKPSIIIFYIIIHTHTKLLYNNIHIKIT